MSQHGPGRDHDRIGDARDARNARADARETTADERDRIGDERDALADTRDEAWTRWQTESEKIRTDASIRDQRAGEFDAAADHRDTAANLDAYVGRSEDADALTARRLARQDRAYSKGNRITSAMDRYRLTNLVLSPFRRKETANRRDAAAAARVEANSKRQATASSDSRGHTQIEDS